MMRLKVNVVAFSENTAADVLAIPVCLNGNVPVLPRLNWLPRNCRARLEELAAVYCGGSDCGSLDTTLLPLQAPFRRAVLVVLGASNDFSSGVIRVAAGKFVQWCVGNQIKRAAVALEGLEQLAGADTDTNVSFSEFTEGLVLGSFRYTRLKQSPTQTPPSRYELLHPQATTALKTTIRNAQHVAESVNLARSLGHEPANELNPLTVVEKVQALADKHGLSCTVIDDAEMKRLGMGAFLAVGGGSATPPRLILLEHCGSSTAPEAPIVIVGKTLTYDSGGYSIKPAESMATMKYDKLGGMTVLGVMQAAALLKLPQRIVGVLAAAENMISAQAYRPGDIVRAMNGKTIEVDNTDAEGRLVLADALYYAEQTYRPKLILDLATLTGAIRIALGEHAAGLFSNHDALAEQLYASGARTAEPMWRLPLWPPYRQQLNGVDADLKNTGGRSGGAITAAMFLKEFVSDRTPWAHLDIAGVATTEKAGPLCQVGATGYGVRMLIDFIRTHSF